MRIAIYGAGAIGGYLGVLLAEAGAEVTLIARGPQLAAIRARGLRLITAEREHEVRVAAFEDPREAGLQDYLLLTLKAPSVLQAAPAMRSLLGPGTALVTAQNGIPWWYFHRHGGPLQGRRIEAVDPGGRLSALLPPERCLGCVVYPAAEILEPGVVRHNYGNRFMLGEPDGSRSPRVEALARLFTAAGLKAPVRNRIRDDIWLKLWGNLSFNPVSALTGGTLEEIALDPGTRAVVRAMMLEAQEVAEALGVRFSLDVDKRIEGAREVGAHRTSMLQDLEKGRSMEIDALVTAVVELGRLVGVETPTIATLLALLKQRARLAGCYP